MQAARPLAKQFVIAYTLACALVGSGSATPPIQQPLIKNITGIQPGGFVPGQFRVKSGYKWVYKGLRYV